MNNLPSSDSVFSIERVIGRKIVVFGDYMVDEYLQGSASRISPEAPVPVVLVNSRSRRLGGAGNVVLNLFALGAKVTAAGLLGDDDEGNWLVEQLNNCGISTIGIMQSDETVTSIKTRVTAQNQQLLRYDHEIVRDAGIDFVDFLANNSESILSGAEAMIISDYGKGVVTKETAAIMINAAREMSIPVIVDPKGSDYSKYRGATVCTPNMKELKLAVGRELNTEQDITVAGVELGRNCSIDYILATRSEDGMSLINAKTGQKKDYPAIGKEVIDVTGAGDTVISVFTLCYASGASNDECCSIANAAASVVVSKFGAATASIDEIKMSLSDNIDPLTKIITEEQATQKAEFLRQQGKRIVFTNGCFDIVHAGHISSFKQAREFGDVLFLGLNSDSSVRRNKGDKRPIISQKNRSMVLEAISYIDYIVIFDDDTPENLIRKISPNVLVKGKDWEGKPVAGGDYVKNNGGEVKFIDLEQGLSTTAVIEQILNVYNAE